MSHHTRRTTAATGPVSPVWKAWRGVFYVLVGQLLARAGQLASMEGTRRTAYLALVLLGLATQGALLLTAAYLCDLAISLMELWADLARKHLELTL